MLPTIQQGATQVSNWTIGYGAALGALGLGGYFATGQQSKTALIPAAFGVAAVGLGLLARSEKYKTAALIGGAVIGVAGFAGSARGLAKLPALLKGEPLERPAAVISQSAMAGLSVGYLVGLAVGTR
ncbi:MAG: hypothetical protein IPK82_21630 [Polyangiaceae bacterium]|nr:hypothetical protein [Polyangiaceae bacterium]